MIYLKDQLSIKKLEEDGFCVVSIKPCFNLLENLLEEIFRIYNTLGEKVGFGNIQNDKDLINFRLKHQSLQYKAVKLLYNSSALYSLAGHSHLQYLLNTFCKFKEPIHDVRPLLRIDMPIKEQSIFSPHQDYSYNLGSKNSVAIWIPLQDTYKKEGSLLVSPKTHLNGIYPNKKGLIDEKIHFSFESCNVKYGEAIIFNQKLVHKSGTNNSNKIRFSIQLRFSDLDCDDYFKRGLPINHEQLVKRYGNEIDN